MLTAAVLCCPACRADVLCETSRVTCSGCGAAYQVLDGVPLLVEDRAALEIHHQADLPSRPTYSQWKERLIIKALPADSVCLDFGAGRQQFEDPNIIKLDLVFDPLLDVVGDLCALPFKADSIDFAFGGAVMEHVRDPGKAISELYRVIKPGGYIYADWAFLAAYHGYPHHYSNLTIQGIQDAFAAFRCLEVGVGPHLGPAFALKSVLATYREHFKPVTRLDRELQHLIDRILWHPLDEHDLRIHPDDRFRIAAGHYFFGIKQPEGTESILPASVLDAYRSRTDLRKRYPEPLNIALPDNLMEWAWTEGRVSDPAIRHHFENVRPFDKAGGGRPYPGRRVREWPSRLMTMPDRWPPHHAAASEALWFSRSLRARLLDSWEERGIPGLFGCVLRSCGRWRRRIARGLRRTGLLPGAPRP